MKSQDTRELAMIKIKKLDETRYRVTVEAGSVTSHIVTVPREDYLTLTDGQVSYEELLQTSFEFLLEREPNTSILREFDIMIIQSYFPDYERVIKSRLKQD